MKDNTSKWVFSLVLIIVLGGMLILEMIANTDQRIQIEQYKKTSCDSLIRANDSLASELFISNTATTRYEIALENLRYEDSVAAEKFDKQLSHTE